MISRIKVDGLFYSVVYFILYFFCRVARLITGWTLGWLASQIPEITSRRCRHVHFLYTPRKRTRKDFHIPEDRCIKYRYCTIEYMSISSKHQKSGLNPRITKIYHIPLVS